MEQGLHLGQRNPGPGKPAAGSPEDLIDNGGLYTAQEAVSSMLVDGDLISWVPHQRHVRAVRGADLDLAARQEPVGCHPVGGPVLEPR